MMINIRETTTITKNNINNNNKISAKSSAVSTTRWTMTMMINIKEKQR